MCSLCLSVLTEGLDAWTPTSRNVDGLCLIQQGLKLLCEGKQKKEDQCIDSFVFQITITPNLGNRELGGEVDFQICIAKFSFFFFAFAFASCIKMCQQQTGFGFFWLN